MSIISTVPKGAAVEGINPNLLRNWYFNHAVNSRNVSSVSIPSATDYLIDGWTGTRIQFAYEDYSGYIAFYPNNSSYPTGYFTQWVDFDVVGKQVTISALLNSGKLITKTGILSAGGTLESDTVDNCKLWLRRQTSQTKSEFFIWGTTLKQVVQIAAVKLELGDQQTLAHQENGVWVLNEIPDYEYELYRCMTSTADSSDTYANKTLATEQELAYVENGTTASRAYAIGEYFCWHGLLYRAKTAIGSGDTFTPGTNCETVVSGAANNFFLQVQTIPEVTLDAGINVVDIPSVVTGYYPVVVSPYGLINNFSMMFGSTRYISNRGWVVSIYSAQGSNRISGTVRILFAKAYV